MTPTEIYQKIILYNPVTDNTAEAEDPMTFSYNRKNNNLRNGITECGGNRQTGRTTQMVITTISNYLLYDKRAIIICHNKTMVDQIRTMLSNIATQLGIILNSADFIDFVISSTPKYNWVANNSFIIYKDNAIDDINLIEAQKSMTTKNIVYDKFTDKLKELDKILRYNNALHR